MRLIILNFSSLNLRYLGCYGSEWVETPNIDRMAANGAVFDCCLARDSANSSWLRSLLGNAKHSLLDSESESDSVVKILAAKNIATAYFGDRTDVDGEELDEHFSHVALCHSPVNSETSEFRSIEVVLSTALQWLEELRTADALVWIDLAFESATWSPAANHYDDDSDEEEEEEYDPREGAIAYVSNSLTLDEGELEEANENDDEPERTGDLDAEDGEDAEEVADPVNENDLVNDETEDSEDEEFEEEIEESAHPGDADVRPLREVVDWQSAIKWESISRGYSEEQFKAFEREYKARVRHIDHCIGAFLEGLAETRETKAPSIFMTSDRGYAMDEREFTGVSDANLNEESIHIPLILQGDGLRIGIRTDRLVSDKDIQRTVLEEFSPSGESMPVPQSVNVFLAARGGIADSPRRLLIHAKDSSNVATDTFALVTPEWKIVRRLDAYSRNAANSADDPTFVFELFKKPDDRFDFNDVSRGHAEIVEELGPILADSIEKYMAGN